MQGLGELEAAVMDVLWRAPRPHRVRDVLEQLAPQRTLAYTTVMTVLDNLHRKGWVQREMDGRAYHYLPSATREEVTARALRDLLDSSGDVEAVLLHFARSVSEHESAVLRDALGVADQGKAQPWTIAITLLLGSAIVAVCAPGLLRRLAERAVDPVVVIVGWILAVVGVIATVGAALVVMTVPATVADTPLAQLVRRPWWYAVHDAPEFGAYHAAGWAAAALLVVGAGRLGWVTVREHRRRGARLRDQLDVLRMIGSTVPCPDGGPATLWLQSDRPVAFSLGGRPGIVVLTDGLRKHLSTGGVDAVVAHERAHVRGRHHLLVACADVLAAAFPFVRLFRTAPAALREQVEVAADTEAVRACGPDALRAALLSVTGAGTPEEALAMARNAVDVRLRYLAAVAVPPSRFERLTRCGSLGALLAATPLLATAVLLWSLSALATAATALS